MATATAIDLGATQASAFLGTDEVAHVFRFNPDEVQWSYRENAVSRDTIGGRVVQLLSVQIEGIAVRGRAGDRGELQRMATNVRDIMNYHVRTQRPVSFRVPSRRWDFSVYVQSMPQIGWEVATTGYPYELALAVEEDLLGHQTEALALVALERLHKGIGYNPSVHGGDASGFDELVQSILAARGLSGGGSPSLGVTTPTELGKSTSPGIPPPPGSTTDAIKRIYEELRAEFPDFHNAGTYVCKGIEGASVCSKPSQHAWGNAIDIGHPGGLSISAASYAYLDRVNAWLLANLGSKGLRLPIAQILWRKKSQLTGWPVSDHENHIHVSGSPMYYGQPPCGNCG